MQPYRSLKNVHFQHFPPRTEEMTSLEDYISKSGNSRPDNHQQFFRIGKKTSTGFFFSPFFFIQPPPLLIPPGPVGLPIALLQPHFLLSKGSRCIKAGGTKGRAEPSGSSVSTVFLEHLCACSVSIEPSLNCLRKASRHTWRGAKKIKGHAAARRQPLAFSDALRYHSAVLSYQACSVCRKLKSSHPNSGAFWLLNRSALLLTPI